MKSDSPGPFAGVRARAARERLAFSFDSGTVPSRGLVDAALAAEARPTFATVAHAEPREWGYVGLLAFTAVLLLRPQDDIKPLAALHLAEVAAFAGIGPMLMHRLMRRVPAFRINPETIGLIVLGLVMLLGVPFSIWPGGSLEVFTDAYIKIVIVFVLMMNTISTPRRLDRLVSLIILCMGYVAARGVFDYARGVNLIEGGRLTAAINGIYGNPNDLALNMVTFMPLGIVIAVSKRHTPIRRLTATVIVLLMMATVTFTKSRGGLVGLVAMLVSLVVLGRHVRRGFSTVVVAGTLLASLAAPASFWVRMASIIDERQDQTEFTGSREARKIAMMEGIAVFLERPLTGVGAGQFKNYNPSSRQEKWLETHNALIQVAAELGAGGLVVFVFLIVRGILAAAKTRRLLKRPPTARGPDPLTAVFQPGDRELLYSHTVALTAGLVGWFTCALFASVAYSWTFYYVLALIVAAREITTDRLAVARRFENGQSVSVPAVNLSRRWAPGVA